MSLKLGNISLNKIPLGTDINKAYLGSNVVFDTIKYLRNLSAISQDCLIMTNSVLNMDVPSTGDFEYGGVFTIPVVNPSQTTGMLGRLPSGPVAPERYGFYLGSAGQLIVVSHSEVIELSDFISDFGGQKVEICIRFEGVEMVILVNNVEIERETIPRPTTGTSSWFVGAYGNTDGITPRAGRFYNGKIHSVFQGSNKWGFNESTGFGCASDVGNYVITGQTSNAGGLLGYWEINVIKLDI